MPRTFSLEAAVTPSVDEQAVEREAAQTRQTFNDELSGLSVDAETGGVAGAGGGAGGTGSLQTGAAAGVGSRLGGGVGGAAKAALPVALAGATAFSISQGIQRLAQASPALQAQASQFSTAFDLLLQPFGKAISGQAKPFVDGLVNMAANFNSIASESGLQVALSQSFGTEFQQNFFKDAGQFVRNGFNSIMKDVAMALHSRGGFTGILLDAAKLGAKNLNAFIEGLTGVNVGAKVRALASDIATSWPGWPDLKNQWPGWSNIVTGVDLASFVDGINIGNFIDIPDFLRDGDPSGEVPGRTPDPPSFGGGGSDPNPPGRFDGDNGSGGGGGGGFDDPNPPGRFDTGGMVGGTGLAVVDRGERVLPPSQVNDRGEADLAQGDQIVRTLRQIRRDLRALEGDSGDDSAAVVDELRRLRREMTSGSTPRASEDDVIAALAKLLDRGGGRNPLER